MVRSLIPSSSSKFQKPCQPIVEKTVLNSTFKRALLDREVSLVLLWVEQETTLRIHCSHRGYNNCTMILTFAWCSLLMCTMMLSLLALFVAWRVLPREMGRTTSSPSFRVSVGVAGALVRAPTNGILHLLHHRLEWVLHLCTRRDTKTQLGQQRLALVVSRPS